MANFQIPYTNPADYTYDSNKIEVSGGLAKLKLQNSLQSFVENFSDDTGFVYDSDLVEFVGGKVQQKNQRPTDTTFYASFTNDENGSWGNGDLDGILGGTAYIDNGKLIVPETNGSCVVFASNNNINFLQTGCVRFKFIPNYTGNPSNTRFLFNFGGTAVPYKNSISLYHVGTGSFYFTIRDSLGNTIVSQNCGTWNPTIGTEYEFELNFDITSGFTRLFINGIQKGLTATGTGIRNTDDCNLFLIGNATTNNYYANGQFSDFIVFSTVQHTANYTPNWSNIKEYDYLVSSVTLPEMEHILPGDLTTFDSFVTVESGNPRYTIQIGRSGDYLYWSGSAWVVSDGSYAQANDESTFNVHVDELDVEGETYGQFKIHFDNSNEQSHVDTLTANLYMDTGYPTDKPSIYKTVGDGVSNIEEFISFTETLGGNNEGSVVYQLSDDGITWLYWDGSIWNTAGINNYNSATVLNAHMLDFDASADKIYVKAIFISNGLQQVELDLNETGYVINTAPLVYAGTNKEAIYNIATTPFSDCLFSDAEGNITKAEWKVEGGVYAEIVQGAYSTLLEAVQAFSNSFTHSGIKNIYLKITDSYNASSEDILIIDVNQITVTINVKDINNNHIPNITWDAGDSSTLSIQSSPFSFIYDIGTYTATLSKTHFDTLSESNILSISTTEINHTMSRETRIDELIINIDGPSRFVLGDTFILNGVININLTNYKIRCQLYDKTGNEIQLATLNSGGLDDQIEIINASSGEFIITCAKDLTDDFDNEITVEVEIENPSGQIRTMFKENFNFEDEDLTWTSPS